MLDVGAVEELVPTLGLVAEILPVIGKGLLLDTPCKLPELSTRPISVAKAGAVAPVGPTLSFEAREPVTGIGTPPGLPWTVTMPVAGTLVLPVPTIASEVKATKVKLTLENVPDIVQDTKMAVEAKKSNSIEDVTAVVIDPVLTLRPPAKGIAGLIGSASCNVRTRLAPDGPVVL